MEPKYQGKQVFAVVPGHEASGAEYDVAIYSDKVTLSFQKSFLPAYMANKHGLIGMLLNKLISSKMKKEEFTVSLGDIKKMELTTSKMMGMTNKSLIFWNVDPSAANYQNSCLTINLRKDEDAIKTAVSDLMKKVDYKEIAV